MMLGGESRPPSTQFPPESLGDRNQMCPAAHFPRRGGHLTEAGQTNGHGPHDNGNRPGIGHLSHHFQAAHDGTRGQDPCWRAGCTQRWNGTLLRISCCVRRGRHAEMSNPECSDAPAVGWGGSGGVRDCHEASPSCLSCKEGLIRPCIRTDPRMTGPIDVPGEGGLQLETTGNSSGHPFLPAAGTWKTRLCCRL